MFSRKGLTLDQVMEIVTLLEQNDWNQATENNPYLFKKFVQGNNNVNIYNSKRHGYSVRCNTEVLLKQLFDGSFGKQTDTTYILQIDDVGIGNPIGGVGIGFLDTRTELKDFEVIDVKYFQAPCFQKQEYLQQANTIVLNKLKEWKISRDHLIQICTGYIFCKTRMALYQLNYHVDPTKIEGDLQDYVEGKFRKYLTEKCCIPPKFVAAIPSVKDEHRNYFYQLVNYIKINPHLRKFCKTGWENLKKHLEE